MNKLKESIAKANEIAMDSLADVQNKESNVFQFMKKHKRKLNIAGYSLFGLVMCLLFSFGMTDVVFATDPGGQVFTRANTAMQGVLRQIRLISSIIAALFLTIAFLMKMFSKNQRTVDEANTWIKRIAIAWACINAVGFILTFIQEIIGPDVDLPVIGG